MQTVKIQKQLQLGRYLRSGVALAMRHRRSGLFIYELSGHRKGNEHPTCALEGNGIIVGIIYLTLQKC